MPSNGSIKGQQEHDGVAFPLVLECRSELAGLDAVGEWVTGHRAELDDRVREHGAVLFRGFPLRTAQDFDVFVSYFGYRNFPYDESLSNAVRVNLTGRVFTANEAPATFVIRLHHEMAQTPIFPSKLFFFCEQPADEGGATPLCRSDVLFKRISDRCPEFARACEEKGLLYSHILPPVNDPNSGMGRSWQSTFRADDKQNAEAKLRRLGYTWQWLPDDCLRVTTPRLPAVKEVSPGRKTFFNQLIAAYVGWKDNRNDPSKSITYGDGSALDPEAVALAVQLAEELAIDVPWQRGDVVLVDNFVVMHGRRPFKGTRKVLASLVASDT